MNTNLHILTTLKAQQDVAMRQEIQRHQLANSLSQPAIGKRFMGQLGHSLVVLGKQLEKAEQPSSHSPVFLGTKTGQLQS